MNLRQGKIVVAITFCLMWQVGSFTMANAQQTATKPEIAAVGRYERFRRVKVQVTGPNRLVGKTVAITEGGRQVAAAALAAEGQQAAAEMTLPMPARGKPYGPLTVAITGEVPIDLALPDADRQRREALNDANFAFHPAVFSGDRFPEGDFEQPNLIEDLIGSYTLAVKFYDRNYHEVSVPSKPGRYGAVVEIKGEDGTVTKRFQTIYRLAEAIDWRTAEIITGLQFPKGLGVDPAVAKEHEAQTKAVLKGILVDSFNHGSQAAALLAALSETVPGTVEVRGNRMWRAEAHWLFGLKRSLGLASYRYVLNLPPGYAKDQTKKWPLMIFLHGSGERGDDLEKVKVNGPPKLAAQGRALPFIVVSPQCPEREWWEPEEVNDLIDSVQAKYRVDADRIYLTGLSMGGFGTWETAIEYPDRFAAIAPVCGYGDPQEAAHITHLPVWAFQGAKDPVVSPIEHQKMVDALKASGGNVRFTMYPEAGHDCWTQTYDNEALYTWLLAHRRGSKEQQE